MAALSNRPRFLQHFRPPQRNPFETLRVNHLREEKGEESFVELDDVTYLIVSPDMSIHAPFSLINLETGQEIESRFAEPVSERNMFGKEINLRLCIRKHTSVSCGNKLAVHFQSGNGVSTEWYFEVVYELRGNALHELERTPMHKIVYERDIHRALFMDANTLIYANKDGVFIKAIGSGTPNRICSAPHIRPYNSYKQNPICMLGANILLKDYNENDNDEDEDEDGDDEELRSYGLYILSPPFTISSSTEELGNVSLENLSTISKKCAVSTIHGNQLIFTRHDLDENRDGALYYKWHVMKYTVGSTTGPAKLYSLPPKIAQHHKLEFDGRYIGHHIETYDGYDIDHRVLVYDTENLKFLDEYNLDESLGWTGDEGFHLCNWGLVVFEGEEMEIFSHDKSMGFDNPVWKRRKDKNASIFYDSGLNGREGHCISPNKQYLLLHVDPLISSKDYGYVEGYRYVMDLQVFYDVSMLLDAYAQHIQPLILSGRGLDVFNTDPGRKAIDFMIMNQMPQIPDVVQRIKNYSEQRKKCLRDVPLPKSVKNLSRPLWELFAITLQMNESQSSAASAAGNQKRRRKLFNTALKF